MSNESKSDDKLALVSRMLTYQREKGEGATETLRTLSTSLPREYQDTVADLKKIAAGDDSTLKEYNSPHFSLLAKLMSIVRKENGETSTLIINMSDSVFDGINRADDFWGGFQSAMSYLITVFVMAMIVVGIFAAKVLPQFEATFEDFGVELPEFTRLVLENESVLLIILAGIAVFVIGFFVLSRHVRRQVEKFEPLSNHCIWLPGIKELRAIYGYFLYIRYLGVLVRAGVENQKAETYARELSDVELASVPLLSIYSDAVSIATKIQALDEELEYQNEQVSRQFTRHMYNVRDTLIRGTQAALGVVVGGLIIAMYLPIFALGSAV